MAGYCPECGSAREDEAAFCTQCGLSFAGVQATASRTGSQPWHKRLPRWPRRFNLPRKWRVPTAVAVAALVAVSATGTAIWHFDLWPWGESETVPEQQIDLDLFPVRYGDKCGFVGRDGRPVINPQFDRVGFFDARTGLAAVALGDKWGLIDRRGQYVVNPQFNYLQPIRGLPNRFAAKIGERVGIVDGNGTIVVNPQFAWISPFADAQGRILVSSGGKLGFINAEGVFLIAPQFDWIRVNEEEEYFHRDLIPARIDTRMGYIDGTGAWRITPQFVGAARFDEATGLAHVVIESTETTIDQAGLSAWRAEVAAAQAQRQSQIENWGYSYIQVPTGQPDFSTTNTLRLHGFVNTEGRLVINPQYKDAGDFADANLAPVQVGETWGYIDPTGALKIAPQFASAQSFETVGDRPLAVVSVQSGSDEQPQLRYGVIDAAGTYVVQPQYDLLGAYSENGFAIAVVGNLWGAIDVAGKFVINPTYTQLTLLPDKSGYLFSRQGAVGTEIGILGLDGRTRINVRGDLCEA